MSAPTGSRVWRASSSCQSSRRCWPDGNAVTELTGLGRCLNVRTLHLNGANVSELSELRALTKLQDITLSHCTRRELLIPLHKSSLTRVTLVDCDLRGDFFHSFGPVSGRSHRSRSSAASSTARPVWMASPGSRS